MSRRLLVSVLLFASFARPAGAQRVETGFLDRTVTVGEHAYRYEVYVPANYAEKSSWPESLARESPPRH